MMDNFFERAFGATIDEARHAIADIRSKLLTGWFGRDPDLRRTNDLGWSLDDPDSAKDHETGGSLLDRLYETNPELFISEPEAPNRDPDRGIDR